MTEASRWNSSTNVFKTETNMFGLPTKWDVGVPAGPAQAVRGIWARWSRLRTTSVSRSRLQQLKRWRNIGGLAWFPWPDLWTRFVQEHRSESCSKGARWGFVTCRRTGHPTRSSLSKGWEMILTQVLFHWNSIFVQACTILDCPVVKRFTRYK